MCMTVALSAAAVGFAAGLLTFRIKSRWCRTCGTVKSCPVCARTAR